jgi:hypothetical protein
MGCWRALPLISFPSTHWTKSRRILLILQSPLCLARALPGPGKLKTQTCLGNDFESLYPCRQCQTLEIGGNAHDGDRLEDRLGSRPIAGQKSLM